MEIFIPGNVPSSKNSRMRTRSGIFIKSPLCFKYEKATKVIWEGKAEEVRQLTDNAEKPILIGLHFVRDSKRKCDFHNLVQFIADLMVKYKWIEDDNMTQVFFVPYIRNGTYYSVNKSEYGVWIKV